MTFRARIFLWANRFTAVGILEWNYTFHGREEKNGHITRVPLSSYHYAVFHNVICNWCNRVSCSLQALSSSLALCNRATPSPRSVTFTNSMNIWTKGFVNGVRDRISRGPRISHPRFVSHEEQSLRDLKKLQIPIKLNWREFYSRTMLIRLHACFQWHSLCNSHQRDTIMDLICTVHISQLVSFQLYCFVTIFFSDILYFK